jgi:flagellar motor switch protein FliN/FliY
MSESYNINNVELTELQDIETSSRPYFSGNIDLIKNVKVRLTVKLGDAEISVDELFRLKEGSVIRLEKEVNMPIDIDLDGKIIARGVIVAVDDSYGIKITEINNK